MASREFVSEQVRVWMDKTGMQYEYDEGKAMLRSSAKMNNKLGEASLVIMFSDHGYLSIAYTNFSACEREKNRILEYITRVNYGQNAGNFEMDLSNGFVRSKTYTFHSGLELLSPELIEYSVWSPIRLLDRYGNGLLTLNEGLSDPRTEMEHARIGK